MTFLPDYQTPACEPLGPAHWQEPLSAWSSLAFTLVGAVIVILATRKQVSDAQNTGHDAGSPYAWRRSLLIWFGVMVALNGIGSAIQHGPMPVWNPIAHDPPLTGALAIVAADAFADLARRRLRHRWWAIPTALTIPLAAWLPPAAITLMVLTAVVAISLTLVRCGVPLFARVPPVKNWLARLGITTPHWSNVARGPCRLALVALGLTAAGGVISTLGRPGWPLCQPDSAFFASGWSGHAIWHLLAAVGLLILAPALGRSFDAEPRVSDAH